MKKRNDVIKQTSIHSEQLRKDVISAFDRICYETGDEKLNIRKPISDIEVEIKEMNPNKSELIISIKTLRPGFLIGKGGRTINKITTKLRENFEEYDVSIKIIENKLFWYYGTYHDF